jgi:hypothetical protein
MAVGDGRIRAQVIKSQQQQQQQQQLINYDIIM